MTTHLRLSSVVTSCIPGAMGCLLEAPLCVGLTSPLLRSTSRLHRPRQNALHSGTDYNLNSRLAPHSRARRRVQRVPRRRSMMCTKGVYQWWGQEGRSELPEAQRITPAVTLNVSEASSEPDHVLEPKSPRAERPTVIDPWPYRKPLSIPRHECTHVRKFREHHLLGLYNGLGKPSGDPRASCVSTNNRSCAPQDSCIQADCVAAVEARGISSFAAEATSRLIS